MLARFDHRPMLTAALALSTAVLVVVVITLAALLITAAPPAATSSSEGGGSNPGAPAVVGGNGDFYGEGWNNYGYDAEHAAAPRQAAKTGNGGGAAIDRHAEGVAADKGGSSITQDPIHRHAEVVQRLGNGSLR